MAYGVMLEMNKMSSKWPTQMKYSINMLKKQKREEGFPGRDKNALCKRYQEGRLCSEPLMFYYSPCSSGRWYKIKVKWAVLKGFVFPASKELGCDPGGEEI